MKKEIIKSVLVILLTSMIGMLHAQVKCDNFGKRKHKGRTSIYKATAPGDEANTKQPGLTKYSTGASAHLKRESSIKMHQYRWSNNPPYDPNSPVEAADVKPKANVKLVNKEAKALAGHRLLRSECQPFRKKKHKKKRSTYK